MKPTSKYIRTIILLNHQAHLLAQKAGKELTDGEVISTAEKLLLGDSFAELERCLHSRGLVVAFAPAINQFIVIGKAIGS